MTKPQRIIVLVFSILLAAACFLVGEDSDNAFLMLVVPIGLIGIGFFVILGWTKTSKRKDESGE